MILGAGSEDPGSRSREVEVNEDNLEDLLECDDIFFDYFNTFLTNPAFSIALKYDRLTGSLIRLNPEGDGVGAGVGQQPAYGASEAQREAILAWVKSERLVFFLQTRFYLEYKMCKYLIRPLQPISAGGGGGGLGGLGGLASAGAGAGAAQTTARPISGASLRLGGVSRTDNPSSADSLVANGTSSTNHFYNTENLYQQLAGLKYLRPGSRAFSLPVHLTQIRQRIESMENKENYDTYRHPPVDDTHMSKEITMLDQKLERNDTFAPNEVNDDNDNDNDNGEGEEKEGESNEPGRVDQNIIEDDEDDEAKNSCIEFDESPEEELEALQNKHLNGTINSLQESKESIFRGKTTMDKFSKFLEGTQGETLMNFWIDCEQFKDDMVQFQEIETREIQAKIYLHAFKELVDKYRLKLTKDTKDQLQSKCAANFTPAIFVKIQYDALRRLRSYWVPRFVIFCQSKKEKKEKKYSEDSQVSGDLGYIDFLPSLNVSHTLSVQPDNAWSDLSNPLEPWDKVKGSGRGPDARIRSAHQRKTPEERFWDLFAEYGEEDEIGNYIVRDKEAGGPFQRYLQQRCLSADNVELTVGALAQYLYWQDMIDLVSAERRCADRLIRLSNAWGIFNKYFTPQSLWAVTRDPMEIDVIRDALKSKASTRDVNISCSHVFRNISLSILEKLKVEWTNYAVRDAETLKAWINLAGGSPPTDPDKAKHPESERTRGDRTDLGQPPSSLLTGSKDKFGSEKAVYEDSLTEKQMRLQKALQTAQDIEVHKTKQRKTRHPKKKFKDPKRQEKIQSETAIDKVQREPERERKKKIQKEPLTTKDLKITDLFKNEWAYLRKHFLEYCEEFEGFNTFNIVLLYFDINKYFRLTLQNKKSLIEYQSTFISSNYLDAYGPKRVSLPKKYLIKEKLTDEKMIALQSYVENFLTPGFKTFCEGQSWYESIKKNKSGENYPPLWIKRRMQNGLPSKSAERAGIRRAPTEVDKILFSKLIRKANEEKTRQILNDFRLYLKKHGGDQDLPFMANSLDYYIEIQRLLNFIHQDQNDDVIINRKIEGILGVYVDCLTSDPKLQIEITLDQAAKIVRQAQIFVRIRGRHRAVEDVSDFIEAAQSIYYQLLQFWAAFWFKRKNTHPSLQKKKKSMEGVDEDEEGAEGAEQFQIQFEMPKHRPTGTQFGSGISFSLVDGIKWKTLEDAGVGQSLGDNGGGGAPIASTTDPRQENGTHVSSQGPPSSRSIPSNRKSSQIPIPHIVDAPSIVI